MALSAAEKQAQYRARKKARDAAIAHGRLLGEDEAKRRGETGWVRENRIERAEAYAAWEFDGKPITGVALSVGAFLDR